MTARRFNHNNASNLIRASIDRQLGKQNRERQNDFSQRFVVNFDFSSQSFTSWSQSYTSYQFQSSAYQNQRYQFRQSNYQANYEAKTIASSTLSQARQSLRITSENELNSSTQQTIKSKEKSSERDKRYDRDQRKARAYVINEKEEKDYQSKLYQFESAKDLYDDHDQTRIYYASENDMNYWNSDDHDVESEKSFALFTSILNLSCCRRCKQIFEFNNSLHKHLREASCLRSKSFAISIHIITRIDDKDQRSLTSESSSIDATKKTSIFVAKNDQQIDALDFELSIIQSFANLEPNIDIDYEFRDWIYAKSTLALFEQTILDKNCLNIDANLTLIDKLFLKSQSSSVQIRIMTTSLSIREIETTQHKTSEYAIVLIYFNEEDDSEKKVRADFRREVHIVNNLKINILIETDVIDAKNITINVVKKTIRINNCNVTILIEIRFSSSTVDHKLIHLRKTITVPSKSKLAIEIHSLTLFDRDFVFESNELSYLTTYAHMIDDFIKTIMIRNDSELSIQILRNHRLDIVVELKYFNVYHISHNQNEIRHLAARQSRFKHQNNWFRKIIARFTTTFVIIAIDVNFSRNDMSLQQVFCYHSFEIAFMIISNASSTSKSYANEIVLLNDVTIHNSDEKAIRSLRQTIEIYLKLWQDTDFAIMKKANWMRISLKSDWECRVSNKTKIYSLDLRDKQLVNDTFDDLHRSEKLFWITKSTSFNYSLFCVWKTINEERKERVVIDIRELNAIIKLNVYSLSLQFDIIQLMTNCIYISVIDCASFFYQWRVHSFDRHKLIVVSHRDQESFNVAIMSYKNSSVYVQRQIDRILRKHRHYARAYVDDIVIFSKSLSKHVTHFKKIFVILNASHISIKSAKVFIDYSTVNLLKQKINSFDLAIAKNKLRAIFKLKFSRSLRQLKIYLDLTNWLREYISHYADVTKSLQDRKTKLLREDFIAKNSRRAYASRIKIEQSTSRELIVFATLQSLLFRLFYLIHVNNKRQLYVNLDVNKKFEFDAMIYHVKQTWQETKYSSRSSIEPILFLSRLAISTKSRYWSTKLKLTDIVWVLKKIKHLVEVVDLNLLIVMYTDHDAALRIVKQISLTTFSIDKLNLRLIRISDYLQRFNLNIRHKLDKQHIVFDALFRLASVSIEIKIDATDEDELDTLFITSLIELDEAFRKKIIDEYAIDLNWQKINKVLDSAIENDTKLSFYRENDLIFRDDDLVDTDFNSYETRRLCISYLAINDILKMIHDEDHSDFAKNYDKISASWYIRDLAKYLRDYLKHCSECQIYQIKRHLSYDSLQSILTSLISFHTIIMNFILALSSFIAANFNILLSIICKFIKRIILILDKITWSIANWDKTLLHRLDIVDWELLKAIIFDRDRKFLSELWSVIFSKLEVKLLYFIAYHSQTDDQFERINQMIEIALRYYMSALKNQFEWFDVLEQIQRLFNNFASIATKKTSNEIAYDFTSLQAIDLSKSFVDLTSHDDIAMSSIFVAKAILKSHVRFDATNAIAFAQMQFKFHYDKKHQLIYLDVDDWALLRLHKDYNISFAKSKKLDQQYVDSFQIKKKIDRLAYRSDILEHWKIHLVFTIAQLKSSSSSWFDSFKRSRLTNLDSIFVEEDTKQIRFFELEKIVNRRETANRDMKYLIRWKEYES